ncbi:TPA: flippase-like domain-containing protein [Candidatus Bathyarchaeota archaeon]|nr:flippase-like domain-containing protein [Candidatus Bathyarchaeota archaeon]
MEQAKPKVTKKTIILPLLGILAFVLYIYFFNVDLLGIIETAKQAQPIPYIAAILISFIEILFYSLSWRELLSGLEVKLSLFKSYVFVWYAIFLDILVPAESISGEIARVYCVNREQCGTSGRVVASLVTFRLLSMFMNTFFLLLGAALLFGVSRIDPLVFGIIQFLVIGTAIMLVVFIVISRREAWSIKIINGVLRVAEYLSRGKWELEKVRNDAYDAARAFHSSMKDIMRNPKKLIIPTFYLALNWAASMFIPYLVFISLGYEVSWGVVLVTTSIVIAIKSIPVGIPFEVGLPEIAMTTVYAALGVPAEIAATSTILSRIITLWLRFGVGFVAYQWTELKAVSLNSTQNNKAPQQNLSI